MRPGVERLVDALRAHVDDLRLAVRRVGDDARLRAGERDRLVPEVVDGHRRERARDALADGDEHVELSRLGVRRHLVRERDEVVGRVAHRREDGDDALALLAGGDDPLGDRLQPLGVGDGSPAELHDHGAERCAFCLPGYRGDGLVLGRRHRSIVGADRVPPPVGHGLTHLVKAQAGTRANENSMCAAVPVSV